MTSSIWQQLALIIAGGLMAIAGGLSSAWLTATLTERRQKNELLQRVHEITGRHEAIKSDAEKGTGGSFKVRSTKEIFGTDKPSIQQIAFVVGMSEKLSLQTEEYIKKAAEIESRLASLDANNAASEALIKNNLQEIHDRRLQLDQLTELVERLEKF